MPPSSGAAERFAEGFDVLTRAEWEELAVAGLRGRSLADLTTTTADGIDILPVHGSDTFDSSGDPSGLPGVGDRTRSSTASGNLVGGWDVRALVADEGPAAANSSVLDELLRGSTSVLLDPIAIGIASPDDLARVLDGVHLEMVTVALLPGPNTREVAGWLLDLWEGAGVDACERRGVLGLDPLGVAARHGGLAAFDEATLWLVDRCLDLPGVRPLVVDATPYADAGATDARQLGWATATGVAVLREIVEHGLTVEEALDQLSFTLSADSDQFTTIARMRVARRLWARVAEASGADETRRGQVQHAVAAASDLTRHDPWVNLLRGTVAAFAAGLGGAEAITVRPFDSALGRSDEFARRLARNTQLLLLEESSLAAVIDPAGGSWYVEHLTNRLAEKAWQHLQVVEGVSGMGEAIASGRIAEEVSVCWKERLNHLATRSEVVTGVSDFPDIDEVRLSRTASPTLPDGPLPLRRRSAVFEDLRDATETAGGAKVGMLALGSQAEHTVRKTFATNLYAVAGIRMVPTGVEGVVELPPIVVVCGSDDRYATDGVEAAAELKAGGVRSVHLVGRTEDLGDELAAAMLEAGVDEFINADSDVVDLLGRTLAGLGISVAGSPAPTEDE